MLEEPHTFKSQELQVLTSEVANFSVTGRSEGARSTCRGAQIERVGARLRELALTERLFGAHTRELNDRDLSRTLQTTLVL